MRDKISIKIGGEENMKRLLDLLLKCKKKKRKPKLVFTFIIDYTKIKGEFMSVVLLPGQFVEANIQAVDRKGNPASVEAGSVKWKSSDESVFAVEQNPDDELKAKISYAGNGVAQLDVTADADLDGDVKEITAFSAIECQPELAASLAIQLGEPQDS